MKTIDDICNAVLHEQDVKNEEKKRIFIPELDSIITMYKYFAILRTHTEPGYLPADVRIDRSGIWYKSICDAREVKCWRKCRMKYQINGVFSPLKHVLVNSDISASDSRIHAILLRFFRLFDHKKATVLYDPSKSLYWFLDEDNEPYAIVCGIRADKEKAVLC